MGKANLPLLDKAFKRCTPVVVSSLPPISLATKFLRSPCSILTRSPPSSMIRSGSTSNALLRYISYSLSVQLWVAKTVTPLSANAAATSSWVDSGLLPVTTTLAPAFLSTWAKYAVFASKWMVTTIFKPLKIWFLLYFSLRILSKGICSFTQEIFCFPDGAKAISRIILSIVNISPPLAVFSAIFLYFLYMAQI